MVIMAIKELKKYLVNVRAAHLHFMTNYKFQELKIFDFELHLVMSKLTSSHNAKRRTTKIFLSH